MTELATLKVDSVKEKLSICSITAGDAAAIDRGCVLPNINDGHSGSAPDLGCYEATAAVPHYGPR